MRTADSNVAKIIQKSKSRVSQYGYALGDVKVVKWVSEVLTVDGDKVKMWCF